MTEPLLRVDGLRTHFPILSGALRRRVGTVHALDGVDLALAEGETLAVVGESGCGKSTLARTVIRLLDPTAGTIRFRGGDVTRARGRALRAYLRHVQMVFQDPYSSLNPRLTARGLLAEPMRTFGVFEQLGGHRRVDELLERVGIDVRDGGRYPDQFSGGQRQRIAIARALAPGPDVVILDEASSRLDPATERLLHSALGRLLDGRTAIIVAHRLATVALADDILVLEDGRVREHGPRAALVADPGSRFAELLRAATQEVSA